MLQIWSWSWILHSAFLAGMVALGLASRARVATGSAPP